LIVSHVVVADNATWHQIAHKKVDVRKQLTHDESSPQSDGLRAMFSITHPELMLITTGDIDAQYI
jgi:hypothetical protein